MTDFYLQQGHGMLSMNREFVENNSDIGVIMSPRNCTREQIERHANELHERNAAVLFDPQFYQPRTERENILNYPYWNDLNFETVEFAARGASELCRGVITYQVENLNVSEIILPGRFSNVVSEEWLDTQYAFADTANSMHTGKPVYSTVAIGPDIVRDRSAFDRLLNEIVSYPVEGIYFIVQSPRDFLVNDDLFLYNILDGLLSIRLSNKKVLLGYANQQSLIFGSAGVTGFATGNFRNVRSFHPDTFDVQEQSDRQRATWYYDGNTLSEFRPQTLGLAYQRGLSDRFGPITEFSRSLLEAANPAIVPWGEPLAFRHYLTVINRQWSEIQNTPEVERLSLVIGMINQVAHQLNELEKDGVRLGDRSFKSVVDATLNALLSFKRDRYQDIQAL
ncbi:hypothetical protein QYF52_19255 [Paenibacillus polymyxa]|uniref:hypothetical protein n=1 Tax=Paenibacillus polymyxa TaxID=1406 RepID=UPI0025B6D4DD|nr:hypothetical protein [Paenibacillus polymyxa]MDN4080086.1 hypothetical protein [Paenibacillus polymyxa]MDN4105092.1 hypothetical protein [Paenibacillus polymyxa]MDN4115407.1 hypothetical protein [Paenibacillus polymyxa]